MARPKMKFTPDEAVSLIRHFAAGLEDHDFCQRHLVRESVGSRYAISAYEPKKALEPLVASADAAASRQGEPVPFPEEGCTQLKDWITTWVSPEGWTRLLAARRQRKSKENRRHGSKKVTPVATADMAAYYLSEMAQTAGFNRAAFLDKLVHHLRWDDEGQAFMKRFNLKLLAEQRKEGRQLLIEAFGCTPGHYDHVLEQALGDRRADRDQVPQAANRLGKPKLVKLATWASRINATDPLTVVLLPRDDCDSASPLLAMNNGKPLPSPTDQAGPKAPP